MELTVTRPVKRTRNTQQRKAVLQAVQALAGVHPTAADIYAHLRNDYPQMSLATVYRALHALVEQNAVCEMQIENVARYDAGPCPHHHLVCRKCGCVTDVCVETLPPFLTESLREHLSPSGFCVDLHPIQFTGICPTCRTETRSLSHAKNN